MEPGIETVARSGSRPRPGILSSVITEEVKPMPGIDERAGITAARRPEFDVMRAFVVAGLVVFHSAMVFASGVSWFVKAPHPSLGFTVFLVWGSLWGMPLLFLVSGMAARYAMRTRSVAAFARERLARLLVPFVVGLVVLVPPMFYLGSLGQPGFHEPYWRFWLSFMNVPALARGLLPRGSWTSGGMSFDPAHLWFLYVLVVFSIALLPLFAWLLRPQGTSVTRWLARFAERHGFAVVCGAAVPLMATEVALGPDVNTGGWERLAYVFPFLYGFVIASQPQLEAVLRRFRWQALAVGCAATGALVAWVVGLSGPGATLGAGVLAGVGALQGLAGWMWVVAIMGIGGAWAARHRPGPGTAGSVAAPAGGRLRRAARYGNEAVLPFYILHEPVIVAAAWLIVRWHVPGLAQYTALVVLSFAATLGLYEALVRRFRLTRVLFGLKPRLNPPAASPQRQLPVAAGATTDT
jgi:glucans biosynthesis protein C